jgi:glycosyltransferase involved in cell wall biosynthesis
VPAPRYSIVVPAYDEEALLPSTLEAIRGAMAAVPWPGEVVVCDNNSRDRTAEFARAGGARVVFEPHNQIARARNAGARASTGEWIVFVDADTRISGPLLAEALGLLDSGKASGGGSVFVMEGVGASSRAGNVLVGVWNRISRRFHVAAGSFLFCRRDAFDAVGGFSHGVYAGEELWFSRAVKRWGKRRGLVFRVLDRHPVATSGRKMEWFSPWQLGGTLALFTVFPFLMRSKAFCRIWYRRPAAPKPAP